MSAGDRHIGPRFQAGKKYLLGGDMLNRMWEVIATNRLLKGPGYDLATSPGQGTTIKLIADAGAAPKQWQLRVVDEGSGPVAQIRSGTLTGLGLSGYMGTWGANEWNTITDECEVWVKLEIQISGAPYTYSTSPETTETVWLPSQVESAEASLHLVAIGGAEPTAVTPTIDPDAGTPVTTGVYYFHIGTVSSSSGIVQDYAGPLGIGWCPPDAPYLVELTES